MIVKSKTLVLTVLLGSLVLPSLASARSTQTNSSQRGPAAGGGGHSGGGGAGIVTNVQFLTRYLTLTSDQVTQLQTLLQTLRAAQQTVQDSRTTLCQQLRTDIAASGADPATVGRDYLALIDNQSKLQGSLTAFETSFSAILTADQLTKFQALIQGAGTHDESGALPGCPPASSTSSSS
jgi:Spy/CpxP family protein refolding chaperone